MTQASAVGRIGSLAVVRSNGDLSFSVEVIAERSGKESFGRVEYKVAPVAGEGSSWVTASSITFATEAES